MFPSVKTNETNAWKKLEAAYSAKKQTHIKDLFATDTNRFTNYSIQTENILFDFSKNNIDAETLHLLIDLANECGLKDGIDAMFAAEKLIKQRIELCCTLLFAILVVHL